MMADEDTAWLAKVAAALSERGLLPQGTPEFAALTGGVSSDIWTITQGGTRVVVKRALEKLRVAQDWRAPVTRNAADAAWLRTVRGIVPAAVPEVLYEDKAAGLFAMDFIEPATAPVWKTELLAGRVDPGFAASVGDTVGRIHAATANRADIAAEFPNASAFHALRLSPYLEATATRHPDLADQLNGLVRTTAAHEVALIHGDVSPKNILVGWEGPIILDAECATYGDPAFDVAFCLNHLLLKGVKAADPAPLFASFVALSDAYRSAIGALADTGVESRAAALLPGLFLARIDGKSPVEYITSDEDRELVRSVAVPLLQRPPGQLQEVADAWAAALSGAGR